MTEEENNAAEEAALDADIAKMLGQSPDESDTDTKFSDNTISDEPTSDVDTSATDQEEEQKPETVELSRYKNLQAKMTQASQEAADLRRMAASQQEQINQLLAQLQARKQPESSPVDDDEMSSVLNDYPEIAGPLVRKNQLLENKIAQLEQMLTGVKQTSDRYAKTENDIATERHFNAIRQAVPDYDDLVSEENAPEVIDWVNQQAPIIQQGFYQGNADDVVTVFNLYKQSKGIPVEKVDRLAEAKNAATPRLPKNAAKPTSNKTTFTREQIAKMSMDQFMKNEAAIDAALASGEIY